MNLDKVKIELTHDALSKTEAIEKVGSMLVESDFVTSEYVEKMLDREEIVTTYIGNNLAIPHGTSGTQDMIKESGISILQAPDGIDFGNGNIAYLVIGIAGKDGTHMDILSKLAVACSDVNTVKAASSLNDRNEVIHTLLGGFDA